MFTKRLYFETKSEHDVVDRHVFLRRISESKHSELYIDLNYKVLRTIETFAQSYSLPCFFEKLYRHAYYLSSKDSEALDKLLHKVENDCRNPKLFLSQVYLWYLGLINGGQYIKAQLSTSDDIKERLFQFDDINQLEEQLKEYINDMVITLDDQNKFIDNVKLMYTLIKDVFDEQVAS